MTKNEFGSRIRLPFYNAGACLPLPAPLGGLEQLDAVNEESEEKDCPQYLQVYFAFSLPS
ncbi:hypothetical protein [Porphyromonas pogonae]|uniref:hypothetical protein n=1 Tax=Porphyromonas pogonae TaxID=867595 RepID=UPI002E767226|nr:hypothetical protein [Porphyromonas pogonae]